MNEDNTKEFERVETLGSDGKKYTIIFYGREFTAVALSGKSNTTRLAPHIVTLEDGTRIRGHGIGMTEWITPSGVVLKRTD